MKSSVAGVGADLDRVRKDLLAHLAAQGFSVGDGRLRLPSEAKDSLRALHAGAVETAIERARPALERFESDFIARLVPGDEINPAAIRPALRLVAVKGSPDARLWRWAALHWSIPTSLGYGRRLRYLVVDEGHGGALMGVLGLQDPVFALRSRDNWIGWSPERRALSLTNLMDAFVVGAVPPYRELLGAKLVALLAMSAEVRLDFESRYSHRRTRIANRDPNAKLLGITTASALGRSSVYNRLRLADGSLAFEPLGFTAGYGDFHFSGAIYEELRQVASEFATPSARQTEWGRGFRNRREVVQLAMKALGLTSELRVHGVAREVFGARLASNSLALLRGDNRKVASWRGDSARELGAWWLSRYGVPRSERSYDYKEFDPESWRLWSGT